jgi:hypothetical protein
MKQVIFFLLGLFALSVSVHAQEDADIPAAKMQFITHLYSSQENYKALHRDKSGENEKYTFFDTSDALGGRYISICQSKADTSQWIYYVEYPMETAEDFKDIADVQPHVFAVLNLYVKTGRLKGEEKTEGDIVRTDLYIAKTNEWFGELVTDNAKKKFYVLLTNARW